MRKSSLATNLDAQANATLRASESPEVSPYSRELMEAAATTLVSLRKSRERKAAESTTNVLTLPSNASAVEVRHARRHRSVRLVEEVFLPSWREATYGLPNALLRSALFSVVQSDTTDMLDTTIASQGDTVLKLTGRRLLDYDRQVFAIVLNHYAKRSLSMSDTSPWLKATFWQFSQSMGSVYGPQVHLAIRRSLVRLNAAHLRLRVNQRDIPLPRLVEVIFEGDGYTEESTTSKGLKGSGSIEFRVPAGMAELFGPAAWTAVPAVALTDYSGIQRWIATYYATHAKPYPLAIPDLYDYSGSVCGLPEFRRRLKIALLKFQDPGTADEIRISASVFNQARDEVTVYLERWNEVVPSHVQ